MSRGSEVCLNLDLSGSAPHFTSGDIKITDTLTGDIDGLPEELRAIYAECSAALRSETDLLRAAQIKEIISAAQSAALRRKLPFDQCKLRPMTDDKIAGILNLYDQTVRELYAGLKYR